MINKKLRLGMFLIFGIFVFTSFASAYTQTYYSSQYNNVGGIGGFSGSQSLRVDERMCQEGTDFLLQIGPLSCTPTVVRSDLLEEENVNVFCQLSATQINPFVDVEMIDWITFNDSRPQEVLGIGYHPAQAALGYSANIGLDGSAILNNLGYVVITLRRQPNESALKNCEKTTLGGEVCWVEGNLTARLRYDIENAFGVGKAVFYLPVMDDEEWEKNYIQYSFWEGRGYLRAEAVEESGASISIYSDDTVARGLSMREREYNLNRYASNINLDKGATSNKIFLPGLSPCLAGLELTLNGVEDPKTRAMLKVNEDYVEVGELEAFLDNKCTILNVDKKGVNSYVNMRCREDERKDTFALRIFPKINLGINGEKKSYEVGEWLYNFEDGKKSVYLGYAGTLGDTTNLEDLYVYLVALPEHKEKLTDDEISSVASYAELARSSSKSGALALDSLIDFGKKSLSQGVWIGKWAMKGESFYIIPYEGGGDSSAKKIEENLISPRGRLVSLEGFSEAQENEFLSAITENYILTEEMKTSTELIYSFEEETKGNYVVLMKGYGQETPNFNMLIRSEEGISNVLGIFYGEDCDESGECVKYKLSLSTLDSLGHEYFLDGLIGAELIIKDKRLTVERISYNEFGEENYKENYNKAMGDFDTVVNSFSQEKEKENSIQTLGEKALYEEIRLAYAIGQRKTMLELCEEFEKDYPDSDYSLDICRDDLKIASSEIAVREVTINGITKRISFEGIKEPSVEDYGAKLNVRGPNGETKEFNLRRDKKVYLSGFRNETDEEKLNGPEYIMLESLEVGSANIRLNLGNQGLLDEYFVLDTKSFEKGVSRGYGGYTFTLIDTNLNKVAKISVMPRTDFAQSETDFKFKIGIEKRNTLFKLSPERTQERIDFLNDSIAEWQKASDALYNVVKTMKASCIGAGAILTFKNFISNYGGKSIARQEVMTGSGGWNEICTGLVSEEQYDSMDNCFLDKSSVIEGEVDALYGIMKSQDEKIRKIEEVNMQDGKGLAQDYVDREGFIEEYSEQVRETLNSLSEEEKKNLDLEDIDEILTLDGLKNGQYTEKQLKEIELYSLYLKSNNGDDFAEKRLSSVLSDIKVNAKKYLEENTFEEETGMEGNSVVDSFDKIVEMKEIQVVNRAQFKDTRYSNMEITENSGGIVPSPTHYSYAIKDSSTGNKYVIIYDADGVVKQTYEIVNGGGVEKLQISKGDGGKVEDNPFDLYFKKYDKASYENTYKASYGSPSVLLRYYEISPFKGFPSVVPFDLKNGWYAGVKTPQTSYDASRVVKSFWLCNVAENGIEEFQLEGFGDDICQSFNLATGQEYTNFPGLSRDESYNLAVRAGNAIETAQKAYDDGITTVSIDRQKIKVGEPSIQTSALQCTDFMSATDCSLLFNVCDPVVCPSSRCNLGGNYPVQNVIQSGIIGSIALCYPNAKWNGGDVYIPVCLTGIYAGLDSWISIQKSYRDCLQTSLDTGETVGICDEINSIYVCEFFWKQALPIINSALPKLLGIITGQNKKGGGEYKGMSSALETAEDSIDYFKQYYAAESYRAFKVRSTEEVGTEICGTFASLTYPDGGSFLDNLIEPDSPVQFMAKFDEISLTTVTNPPTSQYKVYYHVYAGKDSGAYYTVYLRGSGSSYYQDTSQRRIVKSGYISKGDYASETVDFTSPSGYNELCVVVNGQEECGFKEVSTSFAINYVEDMYLSQQATETNITTEEECKSGTSSLYSLLNLNIQSAANNLIDPALYSQGIIRICSTDDPGVGTDARAGMENARWKQVGYCGNNRIGCWIDTQSVRDVIKTMSIEESALGEVGEGYVDYLSEEYLSAENFNSKIEEIKKETSDTERIELINSIFDKVFFNNQKAQLFFWRGKAYSNIAIPQYNLLFAEKERIDALNEEKKRKEAEVAGGSEGETGDDGESGTAEEGGDDGDDGKSDYMSIFNEWYVSPVFEFEDGTRIANLCYKFFSGEWHWIADCEYVGLGLPWVRVDNVSEYTGPGSTDRSREFIISLQEKSYLEGLKLFIERTIKNKKEGFIFWPDLVTDSVEMSHESLFKVDFSLLSVSDLYYRYSNENWWWSPDEDNWMRVSTTIVSGGKHDGEKPNLENIYLINSLESGSSDFYDGAAIIFNVDADATSADVGDVGGGAGGGGGGSWGSEETIDSCTTLKECQRVLGEKLTAIVSEVKKERNDIDYSSIRDQTRAMSFECLVLQVAWIESRVQHCEDTQYENNPLYCEGEPSYLRSGDSGSSVGIMQINTASHPKAIGEGVFYFEENVRYGANFLIDNFKKYEDKTKKYNCGYGEEYTGWAAALRAYNGWNTDCSKGDVYYVENVVAAKDSNLFKRIFPECVQESVGGGGGENW